MGSGIEDVTRDTGGGSKPSPVFKSDSELFEYLCPQYMAMGMTYDEYWNGEAERCRFYRKAHLLKQKEENARDHRMGFYIYDTLMRLVPVLNPMSEEHKPEEYRAYPIPLTQEEMDEQERLQAEKARAEMRKQIDAWMSGVNSNRKRGGEDG